jgi:hypothetical protein
MTYDVRVDYTFYGTVPKLSDAGLFDDLICAQLHFLSLHRCSITCNIVLSANMEFCVSFA